MVSLHQQPADGTGPPEEQLPADDLLTALRRLPPERRTVVVLRYWLDYSPTQIAELVGVPVGTVSSRLTRSLEALRRELEAQNA
jgi:RNA polymerase sigma-70 factor (ECF subfamily)